MRPASLEKPWYSRTFVLAPALALAALAAAHCAPTPGEYAGDAGPLPTELADSGVAEDAGSGTGFLKACETDADCEDGLCLVSKHCSRACSASSQCPGPGWDCGAETDGGPAHCLCTVTSATDKCNGRDDDCDGVIDEDAECDGAAQCVAGACACAAENQCGTDCIDRRTDVLHCGTCDHVCAESEVCTAGACACAGAVCGGTCFDTTSDSDHCGGCATSCQAGQECVSSGCRDADREWAGAAPLVTPQLSSEGAGVRDQTTRLLWQQVPPDGALDRATAAAYCEGLVLDAYSDWRLPTRIELASIIVYGRANPAIDANAFPGTIPAVFWSTTESAADPTRAWGVDFGDGNVATFDKSAEFLVRCVR
jgi:hypothetical protein